MTTLPRPDLYTRVPFPDSTKGNTVFHSIRRAILLRELNSGESLVEQHLGRKFNCSQGTIREALLRLQEEGLVDRRGYRGTIIARTSVAEASQMAEIRIKLESEGIRHAARNFTGEDFGDLSNILANMDAAAAGGDDYTLSELDRMLHRRIFKSSGLVVLEPILMRCALHMHLYTFGNPEPGGGKILPSVAHQPILDALMAHDPEQAASAMREHIVQVIETWAPPLREALQP